MAYIPIAMEELLKRKYASYKCVAITGARQVGISFDQALVPQSETHQFEITHFIRSRPKRSRFFFRGVWNPLIRR